MTVNHILFTSTIIGWLLCSLGNTTTSYYAFHIIQWFLPVLVLLRIGKLHRAYEKYAALTILIFLTWGAIASFWPFPKKIQLNYSTYLSKSHISICFCILIVQYILIIASIAQRKNRALVIMLAALAVALVEMLVEINIQDAVPKEYLPS